MKKTLEDLKQEWAGNRPVTWQINIDDMKAIVKRQTKKEMNIVMKYFWASFALQLLVYSLLTHVVVKYWLDIYTVVPAVAGILIYIPFTHILLRRFKKMASVPIEGNGVSIQQYLTRQQLALESFLKFKKGYEWFLIPLSSAVGVFLVFKLYVPGGIQAFPFGASVTFCITILGCYLAIRSENERNFSTPINHLITLREEYAAEPGTAAN